KAQTRMTWRQLACVLGVGEGGQDAQLLRLRRQRFVYRWNAERLLRALAGMPRAASATEAALSERMQDRDRRARQARDQARRVAAGGALRVDQAGADYWLHRLADAPLPVPELPAEIPAHRAAPEDLDRVYRRLLGELVLDYEHRRGLQARGLDAAAIEDGGYR